MVRMSRYSLNLCLKMARSVFDVSKGWKHYGPGGSYHHFVGRCVAILTLNLVE